MRDLIGRTLGHYRIVEKIGEGGMGVVYRAHDERLDRDVAIKVLPEEVAGDPERLYRFEREAKAVATLSHPNILEIFDFNTEDEVTFSVTELLEGETLRGHLHTERGPLPWRRVQEIGAVVASGLGAAHGKGVIHRDIKPSNIFLCSDGRVKILDFGLAASHKSIDSEADTGSLETRLTREGRVMGTVGYMAPEQVRGEPVDHRSDIFAFGCVLYEMITNRRPFSGKDPISILSSILRDEPTPLHELSPTTPEGLVEIIRRCLEKSPEDRYSSADELIEDLTAPVEAVKSADTTQPQPRRHLIGFGVVVAVFVGIMFVALGSQWYRQHQRVRWVNDEAIPELEGIVGRIQAYEEGPEPWAAFELARRIEEVDPGNPQLEDFWPRFSGEITISTDPPGATVWVRYYGWPDEEAILLGETPLEGLHLPLGTTQLRLELIDHLEVEDVRMNYGSSRSEWHYILHEANDLPEEMVWVLPGRPPLIMPGLGHLEREPMTAFLVDRFEVTNGQFRHFVEEGGYENSQYWEHPFLDEDGMILWKDAMARFTDRTGQPGPASWEVGKPPVGSEEFPVTGVSWFEAAAYAAWAGKSLPTIFHWNRVANTPASSSIVPSSNLNGKGPIPVGTSNALNRFGAYDLAGNVREWIWNASDIPEHRFILGGGFNDPDYAFIDPFAQSAFDRSLTNGFRCIRHLEDDPNRIALNRAIGRPFRDFLAETPVSDEVFHHFLRQFAYDRTPLVPVVEDETTVRHGRRLKVSFDAAYGGEQMQAYLFLPDQGNPPHQAVVVFPGSGVILSRSSENLELNRAEFVLASGRAVLYPIYKGTYERGSGLASDYPDMTALYRDHVIMWGKDVARSIDYLETREDIDASRLAFFGHSWGGGLGAIIPAIEPRFDAVILYVAGLHFQPTLPEVDQINYVTRVIQPTLMLNGKLDYFFPVETSQRPMFELLGTPNEHKKWVLYPRGHTVPRVEMIKEGLAWLDRYLGPVTPSRENEGP